MHRKTIENMNEETKRIIKHIKNADEHHAPRTHYRVLCAPKWTGRSNEE